MDHRIATLLQDGEAAARRGDRAEARRAFRAVLTLNPTNVAALLWLAWLSDDPRARLAYADRALELAPDNTRAHAAREWATSGPGATPQESDICESLETGPSREWRNLLPVAALGSLGAFFAGMLLVLLWYAPRGLPLVAAPEATSCSTPTVLSLPSSTPSPSATPSPPATVTPAKTATRTPTVTPSAEPTPSPAATARPTQASPSPSPSPDDLSPARSSVQGNVRWIDVDLDRQTLTAYEGHTPVRSTLVSTGLPRTPTPVGKYYIYVKFLRDDMRGPDYYLRDVPYTMYFYRGYGLHGTYWHANFGYPMSHGCINLPTAEAEWLFNWASVGTLVNIHP